MLNDISKSFTIILGISIILMTGLLFSKVAKKCRIPDVTGYLLGGLVIGPALLSMIAKGLFKVEFDGILGEELIKALKIFATIELGFIAFTVGSEFKISYFKQVGIMPIVIAFAESFAAVIFITGGMLLFGMPAPFAIAMGAVGGATAPAATIMVLRQYKANGMLAKTTMSVVAIDDASALIFFGICIAIVKAMLLPSSGVAWTIIKPFIEIFGSLILGAITGFLLTFLMRFFKGRGNRLCLVIAMIFLNIGISMLLTEYVSIGDAGSLDLSSLLACMAMGAIFTNFDSSTCEEVMPLVERITPPFVIIFFVLAGAELKLESLSWLVLLVLVIYLVFRVAGKVLGTLISGKAVKAPTIVQKWLGWGLLPQGGIALGLTSIVMATFNSAEAADAVYFAGKMTSYGQVFGANFFQVIVILAVFISEIFGPLCLKYALIKSGEGTAPDVPKRKKRVKKKKQEV